MANTFCVYICVAVVVIVVVVWRYRQQNALSVISRFSDMFCWRILIWQGLIIDCVIDNPSSINHISSSYLINCNIKDWTKGDRNLHITDAEKNSDNVDNIFLILPKISFHSSVKENTENKLSCSGHKISSVTSIIFTMLALSPCLLNCIESCTLWLLL